MNTIHRPDPEFVGNLERELRSTIRRQGRFDNGQSSELDVAQAMAANTRWDAISLVSTVRKPETRIIVVVIRAAPTDEMVCCRASSIVRPAVNSCW